MLYLIIYNIGGTMLYRPAYHSAKTVPISHLSPLTSHLLAFSAILSAACAIDDNILHRCLFYHRLVESILLVRYIYILEEEVHQTVLV